MTLKEYLATHPPQGFKPVPCELPGKGSGNLIHWYWDDELSYSEPVHHGGAWVGSIHRAMSDKRVVGVTIHREAIKVYGIPEDES